jgi:hypothetical protein
MQSAKWLFDQIKEESGIEAACYQKGTQCFVEDEDKTYLICFRFGGVGLGLKHIRLQNQSAFLDGVLWGLRLSRKVRTECAT